MATSAPILPSRFLRSAMALIVVVGLCAAALAYVHQRWQQADRYGVQPVTLSGKWIKAAGEENYSAYFRKKFVLTGDVRHAWMAVSACDAFEVTINGNPVGRHYLWRPTRPFQTGISEPGQRLTPEAAMALNFPREYQWADSGTANVPLWFDTTPYLQRGENVIGIQVRSRRAPAKVQFDGRIELRSGQQVSFASGPDWRAERVPKGIGATRWTTLDYLDTDWQFAQLAQSPKGSQWSLFPTKLYRKTHEGEWLVCQQGGNAQSTWFGTDWQVEGQPREAYVRLLTNRPYNLFINGLSVQGSARAAHELATGQWLIGTRNARDPTANPELLDSDETASIFVGDRFESPRGMHTRPDAIGVQDFRMPTWMNSGSEEAGVEPADPSITERSPISPSELGRPIPVPERLTPKALTRDGGKACYTAYSIAPLLKPGANRIEIRLSEFPSADSANWAPGVSFDGYAVSVDGRESQIHSSETWTVRGQLESGDILNAVSFGRLVDSGRLLPNLQFQGLAGLVQLKHQTINHAAKSCLLACGFAASICLALCLQGLANPKLLTSLGRTIRWLTGALLAPTLVVVAALLVESSFAERQELLWFQRSITWRIVFAIAVATGWLTLWLTAASRAGSRTSESVTSRVTCFIREAPSTLAWRLLVFWLLVGCGLLRGYQLDFQPLDDDEYASTQAILAIAETGVPGFVPEGVYYTRSPLYHYLGAAFVKLFGDSLWSLRLPSVAFSVATAWLAYLFGTRLMNRPWVGLGALVLIALHPFEVFTGHVARFYQMQQFFALLTIYWFCRGFVVEQRQHYRYLTIGAFLASVLSQEISAAMGVQLAVGYVLFAKELGWRANLKLIVVAGFALAAIALDYLIFQTRCLTRVEGISPSLEATVKPHFWQPWNFFAMFIGYSRLHLALSCLLVLGLPFVWKERHRPTLALNFMLIAGVVLMNLLVTHVSLRYQYWLIPLWILLSLDAMRALVDRLCRLAFDCEFDRGSNNWLPLCLGGTLFVAIVLSWSPWRMIDSYDTKILGDSTGAMRFVKSQRLPGDKLMATEPHTHAGYLEGGGVDYDLSIPLLYDFVVMRDGKLVDRNAGAEAVGSLHQLQRVFRENDRVWVVLNREKFRTRGKNIRWQYPGARAELFLRQQCEIKHETYLWTVFLWDANAGVSRNFRRDGVL